MPGFEPISPASCETEEGRAAARPARQGLCLFAIYFLVYGTFVGLNAFAPEVMSLSVAGVNLAVVYGMGLIGAAVVFALVYCWLCRNTDGATQPASGEVRR